MKNKTQPDDSRVLMSDSLRESLGDDNPFSEESTKEKYVIIALDRIVGGKSSSVVGSLVSVLFDQHIEIEMRVSVEDAMNVIKSLSSENTVKEIQLHHGLEVVSVTGNYSISALRMQDMNPTLGACVLAMKLSA